MVLNTISLPVLTELAENLFLKEVTGLPNTMRESGIVQVMPIPENTGNSRQMTEIDLEEYASVKAEGGQSSMARVQQGYTKTLTSYRISKDIDITYEMRTQGKYNEIKRRLTNLGKLAPKKQDLDLSHRITFCTATSYTDADGQTVSITTGDGLALASTVHTLTGSSSTYRSRLANNPALSKGGLEAAEKLTVEESFNNFGEKVAIPFDILFTTDDPNTINTAKEILQSTADVTGSNSGVTNVYKAKYKHVVLPRVATTASGGVDTTKRTYWGLVSSEMTDLYLGEWEPARLKTPLEGNNGEDFSTDNWTYGVRAGYGICAVTGKWYRFSSGDGTA